MFLVHKPNPTAHSPSVSEYCTAVRPSQSSRLSVPGLVNILRILSTETHSGSIPTLRHSRALSKTLHCQALHANKPPPTCFFYRPIAVCIFFCFRFYIFHSIPPPPSPIGSWTSQGRHTTPNNGDASGPIITRQTPSGRAPAYGLNSRSKKRMPPFTGRMG